MENEWIPSEEEYNPGITKEQWIEFIQDKNIFNENALITFACIQKAKVATCADMAEDFGRNANFYNSNVWRTGERIYKKINCPLWQRENGTDRFWSVCCFGRDLKNGRFEFKVRPELQEAFEETGILEGVEVMEKKEKISCIMANIAWNENDWKSPSDNKTNFRWTQVEGNIPNESWNFDFDNPRNSEKEILGFTQFTNPPKNAEKDKFLIIFRSDNKIIGFYGNAEIKKVPLTIKEDEYVNLLGDKKFSVLLKNKIDDSNHNFLFGKKKIGQVGFNYLNPIDAQTILDEAIKTNPNQIDTLEKIKEWLNQGDSQMAQEDTLVKKYANLLKNTKNLILTGAPGTGKTYLAKQIAKELGCKDDNIGFVQFHPSYDYTDFVEGLRPTDKDGNGNVGFERRDGVFKDFCAKALKNLVDSRKTSNLEISNFDEVFESFIAEIEENQLELKTLKQHKDFYLRVGPQKTIYAIPKTDTGTNMGLSKDKIKIYLETGEILDWKPYLTAIGKYIEEHYELQKNEIKPEKKNFVFIIDEINRGEVAKIFGELFYCVDPGYRGEKGRISTQYQNLVTSGEFQKGFFIPENVYIIGTMNDIDRSVESMDFAFRRRFTWAEVKAKYTQYMLDIELDKDLAEKAKRRMENLNSAISEIDGLNEAYHIGASYFLKLKNYDGDFESLWDYHIKGILSEYLRGSGNEAKIVELKKAYDEKEE